MSPIPILKSISRLNPGTMLDIGARDFAIARRFAEIGYSVHAIDPDPPADCVPENGITFTQTTLEDFETDQKFDLVVASLVSHLVSYEVPDYLARLKSLTNPDGLIYVTLLGDEDDWARRKNAKAMRFEAACSLVEQQGLTPLYRSSEWLQGSLYSGEPKFWHLFRFVLRQTDV
ncbi:MAG: class I SAM-dependent methyltransferase [Methyloligellaceae bacterium]